MRKVSSLVLVFAMFFSLVACGQKAPTWQEQYDLGVRYLSDGNYEEAIIAFTAAIEIDPKKAEAYIGRGDAYTTFADMAEDTEASDKAYKKAMENYLQALALGDTTVQEKIDALNEIIQRLENSKEYQGLLKELYAVLSSNDMESAKALMRNEEYRAMSTIAGNECFTYQEREDFCLAVYNENCYYFGQWESGQRSGEGLWIQAAFDESSSIDIRQYDGVWEHDLPNGKGTITTKLDLEKLQIEAGHTTSILTEVEGTFKDGFYHGEIYEIWHMNSDDVHIWTPITAINGVYQAMENVPEEIKSRSYYQEQVASGSYIVAFDQQNQSTDLWDSGNAKLVFGLQE